MIQSGWVGRQNRHKLWSRGVVFTKLKYRFIVFSVFFLRYFSVFGILTLVSVFWNTSVFGIGIGYRPRTSIKVCFEFWVEQRGCEWWTVGVVMMEQVSLGGEWNEKRMKKNDQDKTDRPKTGLWYRNEQFVILREEDEKQTDSKILPTPTDIVGVGNYTEHNWYVIFIKSLAV